MWSPRGIRLVALCSVLAVSACGGDERGEKPAGTLGAAGPATITLKLIAFKPAELAVSAGSTVTWVQDDVATHTVTSGRVTQSGGTATAMPDGKFDSGTFTKGQTFQFLFSNPGDFPFFCSIHPATMTGVVHVT